ncbi:MAG: hypothetical protein ACJ71Z_04700 [Aeromicrobium sp.]
MWIGALVLLNGVGTGIPVVIAFLRTGLVERFPTLIVATALVAIGVPAVGIGMVLRGILKARAEMRRLFYLQLPSLGGSPTSP